MATGNMRPPTGDTASGKVEKRNRPPTSCEPCRVRKLKCNRGSPCDSCIQRHKQSSCDYAVNANRGKIAQSSIGGRLQNLENIVFQFLQTGVTIYSGEKESNASNDQTESPSVSNQDVSTETKGSLHVDGGQLAYVDSNHWLAILDEIKEVRQQLSLSNNPAKVDWRTDEIGQQEELDLMFSPMPSHDIREILQSLPLRPICDSLLSQYFNSRYVVLPIIHPSKFQKEYEEFWQDSSKTPTIWIGLLFSILGIAATIQEVSDTTSKPKTTDISANMFRLRTRQCIVLGKYATARAYGVETLVLHLQSSFLGLLDSNINIWFLMGILIRLAMRLGYHRDSARHSTISPFEGEMRRRIWAVIYQLDILASFQLGLPSMISDEYCDTQAPKNLHYSDFDPDTTILPPSRPLSDNTAITYTIIKSKIMHVFKRIVGHTQSLSPRILETTIGLDMEMRKIYNDIPPDFKLKPISQSFMDASSSIMNRYNIQLLYLKGIVVLHRRYLNSEPSSLEHAKSRRSCQDAALSILSIQSDLHQASQLGGRLYNDRWMMSSFNAHDFLLAAMVVCLDLSVHLRNPNENRSDKFVKQLEALETSHTIWASTSSNSKDASTAARALEIMIQKIKDSHHIINPSSIPHPGQNLFGVENSLSYVEPLSEMLDGSEDLDWTLLDQCFQNNDGLYEIPPLSSNAEFDDGML